MNFYGSAEKGADTGDIYFQSRKGDGEKELLVVLNQYYSSKTSGVCRTISASTR